MVKVLVVLLSAAAAALAQDFQFPQEDRDQKDLGDGVAARSVARLGQLVGAVAGELDASSDDNNVVFSPASVSGALALVLLGSSGKTFTELATVLGFPTDESVKTLHEQLAAVFKSIQANNGYSVRVTFATGLFIQKDYNIRDDYRDFAEKVYGSELASVDFARDAAGAQKVVNQWVERKTEDKIKEIIPEPPSEATKVIVASTLYFKAKWAKPFFPHASRRKPFYPNGKANGEKIYATLMANGGFFPYVKDEILGCEMMGFPYEGNTTTMYVIKPYNASKQRLKQLELNLNPENIQRLVSSTKYTDSLILFPKMKLEATLNLNKILKELHINDLFDPQRADLSQLSSKCPETNNQVAGSEPIAFPTRFGEDNCNPGIYVSDVRHKVYVDVTEAGTEAAAATSASLTRDGGRINFRVDEPFIFFIMHRDSGVVLFWGSVTVPTPNYKSEE